MTAASRRVAPVVDVICQARAQWGTRRVMLECLAMLGFLGVMFACLATACAVLP